jgi:hypothetical protein
MCILNYICERVPSSTWISVTRLPPFSYEIQISPAPCVLGLQYVDGRGTYITSAEKGKNSFTLRRTYLMEIELD